MNNTDIKTKRKAKYLGVILDDKLNFTKNVKNICKKGYASISLLYNLLSKNSKLNTKNKTLILKMLIKPIILYAAPIWGNTCTSNIKKLELYKKKH